MKTTLFALLILFTVNSNSQSLVKEVKNTDLKDLIGSTKSFKNYKLDHKSVNVFVCSNESGSAKHEETDETTDRIYISLSDYDENPKSRLYVVESVFNVVVEKVFEDQSNVSVIINYGNYGKKKSETLKIPK